MYRIIAVAGLVLLGPLTAAAQTADQHQPVVLTMEGALDRARSSAPAVVAARLRIEETRGRLVGASRLFTDNPTVDLEAGRRSGETSTTDYGVGVGQDIALPPLRRARLDAVRAAVTQEEQRAREVEREMLREVATTFLRALESRERAAAAARGKHLADEALRIAERRYSAGDVAQLDVNLARTAVARTDAAVRIAHAGLTGRLSQLQLLLGMGQPVTIEGTLAATQGFVAHDLVALAADRPDLRLLEAEIAEVEAERRLARTLRWPELGLRASYEHEEGDRVVMGGVGLSLPFFDRGQQETAIANARLARLRVEADALRRSIETDLRAAIASHDALRAAAIDYERSVLPLIEENEKLALESYEVGQIGLADLLLVRSEALDARRTLIDQLVETRLAEVELRAKAGAWAGVGK